MSSTALIAAVRRRRRGGVRLLAWDSFNRANSTTSLGTSDSGHVWVGAGIAAEFGITSGKAYVATAPASGGYIETLDVGSADVDHSALVLAGWINARAMVLARASDADNLFYADAQNGPDSIFLKKITAGVVETLLTVSRLFSAGQRLGIRCRGSTLELMHEGVSIGSVTSTFNQGVTKHGLGVRNTLSGGEWDDVTTAAA